MQMQALPVEQSCKISSRYDLYRWSLRLFEERSPQQEEQEEEEQDEWLKLKLKADL